MPTPDVVVTRFAYTDMGVFGRLMVDGQLLFTVERPWLKNMPRVSCIPEGTYSCKPRFYNRGRYDAVEVTNVPDRTHILFHKGNTMHDVAGCIAVASRLGTLKGIWAGLESAPAFDIFMNAWGSDPFVLKLDRYVPEEMDEVE
jgi:hypothetical protein